MTTAGFRAECRWVKSRVYEFDLVNRNQKILVWIKQREGRKADSCGDSLRAACQSPRKRLM